MIASVLKVNVSIVRRTRSVVSRYAAKNTAATSASRSPETLPASARWTASDPTIAAQPAIASARSRPERRTRRPAQKRPRHQPNENWRQIAKQRGGCGRRSKDRRVVEGEVEREECTADECEHDGQAGWRRRGAVREPPRDQDERGNDGAIKAGGGARHAGPPHENRRPRRSADCRRKRQIGAGPAQDIGIIAVRYQVSAES